MRVYYAKHPMLANAVIALNKCKAFSFWHQRPIFTLVDDLYDPNEIALDMIYDDSGIAENTHRAFDIATTFIEGFLEGCSQTSST